MIVGIDEVGRGPWAGPLVVGAVVLGDAPVVGLTDSKKLSKKRRETLAIEIITSGANIGLGWVHADEIDDIGLSRALIEATKRALAQISMPYHKIIIDGTVNFLEGTGKGAYVTTLKKADLLIPSVSAASIVAKVARDDFMTKQHELYPKYGFAAHVGYGTMVHREAIEKYGVTPLHRLSFGSLAHYQSAKIVKGKPTVTTKSIGDSSENLIISRLRLLDYEIIERNWKVQLCEIDIIAQKDDILYFVEVKHRKIAHHGGGLDAITPKKRRQMEFAARVYVQYHCLHHENIQLAVATTAGDPAIFEQLLLLE